MTSPFPLIYDTKRFPILASRSEVPLRELMGCDDLMFFAPLDVAAANHATRLPGLQWHLYGDTRWPSHTTWVEFPLKNYGASGHGGVLVMREEIPDEAEDPLEWAAYNHPLATILPTMRAPEALANIFEMFAAQDESTELVPGPDDRAPAFIHGYCIYWQDGTNMPPRLIATYTDILNANGVPDPRFRVAAVEPKDVGYCQFALHSLFRLNESRLKGVIFAEFSQIKAFAPALMEKGAIPPKWTRFHPSRVLRTRPTLRALPSPTLVDGLLNEQEFRNVGEVRQWEAGAHMLAFNILSRPGERGMALYQMDSNASLSAFVHRSNGGSIYLLPDRLVEEFDQTDCSEVRVTDIVLPFHNVFLKFTPPQPIKLAENADVDGCYVVKQADELLFILTGRLEGIDYEKSLSMACIDPTFSLHLPASDPEMTIDRAVELGIEDFLERNRPPEDNQSTTVERPDGTVAHMIDIRAESRRKRIEEFRVQEPAFRACLNIVVNAACFISFRPGDIADGWEGEPPQEVLAAVASKDDSRRSRDRKVGALKKIENGDFTRVKICGRDLFGGEPHERGNGEGKSPRAHWRRGHWRRQRHGGGLALVIMRWIHPTIVNKDSGTIVEAKIYEV